MKRGRLIGAGAVTLPGGFGLWLELRSRFPLAPGICRVAEAGAGEREFRGGAEVDLLPAALGVCPDVAGVVHLILHRQGSTGQ